MRSFLCTILQSCFEETKQIKDIFSIVLKLKNKKQIPATGLEPARLESCPTHQKSRKRKTFGLII